MTRKFMLTLIAGVAAILLNTAVELAAGLTASVVAAPVVAIVSDNVSRVDSPKQAASKASAVAGAQQKNNASKKPPAAGALTDVKFQSTARSAQTDVPVSFGQVFASGALAAGDALAGALGSGAQLPLQTDVKATYPDGSVRHAVLSAVLPSLDAGEVLSMNLVKASAPAPAPLATPADLVRAGFSTRVTLMIDGQRYTASVDELLKTAAPKTWLKGGVANEWIVSAPLRGAAGPHPHLTARFDVRAYAGMKKARVDVVIENNWAYEPAPRNYIYDVDVAVGGAIVYAKTGLTHYHHARWKKSFWWGDMPQVSVRHNAAYLIATRAVPNYDQSALPSNAALSRVRTTFAGARTEPMSSGLAMAYMPTTGGRSDLGILPGWAVTYLLSMDRDAKSAMLGTADLAGSWSVHYRDKKTDRVISLLDYPYMTLLGREGDTMNPVTKKSEAFPACGGDCTSPLTADSSHQPGSAYLPYLVSGDHYYLEELQFWAMFNLLQHNPGYRDSNKGLVKPDQVRGQAWSLRTLAEAAYITPDIDPLKAQLTRYLSNNLDWYNAAYTTNKNANNSLGAITDANAMVYGGGVGLAPWQDDFFTMAIGHVAELGFTKAAPLLKWKSTFPVNRMVAPRYCWIDASITQLKLRDSPAGANYISMAQAYKASQSVAVASTECGSTEMAWAMKLRPGEMVGHADVIDGYPAYLQPALAYSVDSGNGQAGKAWTIFQARSIKPNYAEGAQFAILPR